jgi:hypothetical protein
MTLSRRTAALAFAALALLPGRDAAAAVIGAVWNSPTSGTLDGNTFTVAYTLGSPSLFSLDLSGSDYSAGPLSASQETVAYATGSTLTVTFANPVDNLYFYNAFFRGSSSGVNPPTYTFNQPFTILSGNAAAAVAGTTLTLPATGFHSGIIGFAGPVSSFMMTPNSTTSSQQAFTLGAVVVPVPEPSSLVPAAVAPGLGLGVATRLRRRGRSS